MVLLQLYIYGYLNRVQSSRRVERKAGRNVEVMWLLGRLAPEPSLETERTRPPCGFPLPIFSLDFVCKLVPLPSHLKKCFLGFVVHCRRCAGFGFFSFAAILFRFVQHGDHRCILSSASTRCF